MQKISINTIDKNRNVCYTENKLENKTKILTNNKNKNKKENKNGGKIKPPKTSNQH